MTGPVALLERGWRNAVVYPLLRLIFHNRPITLPIDLNTVDSILILRYDKIGDMIVTLPVLEMLKRRKPGVKIGIVASEANLEIVRKNKHVSDLYVIQRNPVKLLRELNRIRRVKYDVVLDFIFNRMTSGALIANCFCRHATKVGLGQKKYAFYFNALLSIPRGTIHMFDMLARYIEEVFGITIPENERRLRLDIDSQDIASADRFLDKYHLKRRTKGSNKSSHFIVFNLSARQANKRLTKEQAIVVARFLSVEAQRNTMIIFAPEDKTLAMQVQSTVNSSRCIVFPEEGEASLREVASLIEGAKFVLTPDTAIVHIASATATPVVGIFTPLQVNAEWLPYKVRYQLIKAPDNEPVSSLPPETIVNGIRQFLEAG